MASQSDMLSDTSGNSASGTRDRMGVGSMPLKSASATASVRTIAPASVHVDSLKPKPTWTSVVISVSITAGLRPGVSFAQVASSKPAPRKKATVKATGPHITSTAGPRANNIAVGGITFTQASRSRPPSRTELLASGHTTPSLADSEFMQDTASACTTASSSPEPIEEEKPLQEMEGTEATRDEPIDGPRRAWPVEDYCQIPQPYHVRPACTRPSNWPEDEITPSKFENYPPLTCYLLREEVQRIVEVLRQSETHSDAGDSLIDAASPSQEFSDHVDRGRRLLRYTIYQFCLDIGLVEDNAKKLTDVVTSPVTLAHVCHESLILFLALNARAPSAFGTPFSTEYAAKAFQASIALIHDSLLARVADEQFGTQIVVWTLLPWIDRVLDTVIIPGMSETGRAESASQLMHNIAKVRGRA